MKKLIILLFTCFLLFSCWKSEEEIRQEKLAELQKEFEAMWFNFDNTEVEKEVITVKRWDSYTLTWSNDKWQLAIKIYAVNNYGTRYEEEYSYYEWKNLIWVIIESENVWKVPAFFDLFSSKIITKDEYEYNNQTTSQLGNSDILPQWYGWCVQCESNPWDKNIELILFDIPTEKLEGSKLVFDEHDKNYIFEFEL